MSDHIPAPASAEAPHPDARASEAQPRPSWEAFRALAERLDQRAIRRDGWTLLAFGFAGIAVLLSIIAIGFGSRAIDDANRRARPASTGLTASSAPAAQSGSCPSDAGLAGTVADHGAKPARGSSVAVEAGDFFFSPTCVTGAPAGTLTLTVHNGGQALHNVSIPDQGVDTDVAPGQNVTVSVKVGGGAVPYFCKYHRTSGMVGSIVPGADG